MSRLRIRKIQDTSGFCGYAGVLDLRDDYNLRFMNITKLIRLRPRTVFLLVNLFSSNQVADMRDITLVAHISVKDSMTEYHSRLRKEL